MINLEALKAFMGPLILIRLLEVSSIVLVTVEKIEEEMKKFKRFININPLCFYINFK